MSKLVSRHVFTSESVSEGHPDKVCDQISDAILDACLERDPASHVACETAVGTNLVCNLGEISGSGLESVNPQQIAREVVRDIGYDDPKEGFSFDTFNYVSALHGQSPDINQGVSKATLEEQGAGDQGMMFGYASNATPELMPAPIVYAHQLLQFFTALRKNGEIDYLRPDSKSQVSVLHEGGKAKAITSVVISHQTRAVPIETIRKDLEEAARAFLKDTGMVTNDTTFFINPTGRFVVGG
ncbi:MAG: methionine adenosyltransferase, partial [Kiritimatiellae bacterium]|nr:methionine adenosyltransferase [Kiritimatiellia bacterium]